MSGGRLWNDYGACELDTPLSACQHNIMVFHLATDTQKVVPHSLSIYISPHPTSFRPLPFGPKLRKVGELPGRNFKGFLLVCSQNLEQNIALFFGITPTCNTDDLTTDASPEATIIRKSMNVCSKSSGITDNRITFTKPVLQEPCCPVNHTKT